MSKYRRLNLAEREELSRGLACGQPYREIARGLGRNVSTVSREVRRNAPCVGWYRATEAQRRAARRHRRRSRRLHRNPRLRRYVFQHLRLAWSPEQIAQGLKRAYPQDPGMRLSHEALYTYLYVLPRGGLRKELLSYLRQHRKQRHPRSRSQDRRGQIPEMISIEERPAEVADRSVPGHWEGDLLMGRRNQSAVGTLVERTTRTLILVPLKGRDAQSVRKAFAKELKGLPRQMRLTLTYDRGKEMAQHQLFTRETKMQVYFAHPQSPWERGTNENTNGLLRQYFPKGTDFST
ncbi:MAG: IS30 family transposase, partial [Gammaproteobacteria bacterium]